MFGQSLIFFLVHNYFKRESTNFKGRSSFKKLVTAVLKGPLQVEREARAKERDDDDGGKKDVRALSIEIAAAAGQVEGEEERRSNTCRN